MTKDRNYGIDLLRIVLMFMVCILHVLSQGGVLGLLLPHTLKYNTFWFMEILCFCAVDGFAFISGYTAKDKNHRYSKLADMWLQVFFYSCIITIILYLFGYTFKWKLLSVLFIFFPITFNMFWYFTAYFGLYLIIPLLNKFLFSLDENTSKTTFVLSLIIVCVISPLCDLFDLNSGYSVLWLIILYCNGVLAKKIGFLEKTNSFILIILWALCILSTWIFTIATNKTYLVNYLSPTIVLSGIIMVVLFSRIKLKSNIVSKFSPLVFGIYLLQMNPIIWNRVIKDAFVFIVDKPLILGVVFVLLGTLLIFIAGLLVEFIRSTIAKLIKLPKLSEKIIQFITFLLNKFFKIFRFFFN